MSTWLRDNNTHLNPKKKPGKSTWFDLARRFFPDADDELIDFLLWERTCYPMGSVLQVARQLKKEAARSQ